jgi:hypothetical protein
MTQNYIYAILNKGDNVVKIGFSNDPNRRIAQIQTNTIHPLELLLTFKGDCTVERAIHEELKDYRISGEWFENHPFVFSTLSLYMAKQFEAKQLQQFSTEEFEVVLEENSRLQKHVATLAKELKNSNVRAINAITLVTDLFKMSVNTEDDHIKDFKEENPRIVKELSEMVTGFLSQEEVLPNPLSFKL